MVTSMVGLQLSMPYVRFDSKCWAFQDLVPSEKYVLGFLPPFYLPIGISLQEGVSESHRYKVSIQPLAISSALILSLFFAHTELIPLASAWSECLFVRPDRPGHTLLVPIHASHMPTCLLGRGHWLARLTLLPVQHLTVSNESYTWPSCCWNRLSASLDGNISSFCHRCCNGKQIECNSKVVYEAMCHEQPSH